MTMRGTLLAMAAILWIAAPPSATAADELSDSPLREVIVEHLQQHPEASLEQLIAFANASLGRYGLDFEVYMAYRPPDGRLVLDAGSRQVTASMHELVDEGPCGEHWFTIPVRRVDRDSIEVVLEGETLSVRRPPDLKFDQMKILAGDQQRVIKEIDVSYGSRPDGVLADGSAVILYFGVGGEFGPWWERVRAAHPNITAPGPFLLLQVAPEGIEFVTDIGLYAGEPAENVKDVPGKAENPYLQRDRFPRSGLVVEYLAPCT